ncbi:hypothetical protein DYB30_008560, partial [Aphanomyces astaci]
LVFAWGDSLEHDPSRLQVTLPARLLLIVMQCSTYFLVKWDLVKADEQLMFALALCHGIPTLLLFTLQHAMLHQWDALFVVFGLSFYTIPKVTPLGFVYSTMGSTITMVVYFAIALFCRPPPDKVSRTLHPSSAWTSTSRHPPDVSGTTLFLGVLLWGVFTLGSFASVPDTFKFVDEETGHKQLLIHHPKGATTDALVALPPDHDDDHDEDDHHPMVSVLPSFKAGKCFFCNKNTIVHYMRTLTGSVTSLKNQIKLVKEHESHSLAATVQLQRAMHEIADKHKHELECVAKAHAAKVQTVLKESNATLLALTQQRDQQRRHAQQLEAALDKETRRRIDADAAQAQLMARVERQNTRLAQLEIEGLRESVGKSSSI